jgi:hypothetical protein
MEIYVYKIMWETADEASWVLLRITGCCCLLASHLADLAPGKNPSLLERNLEGLQILSDPEENNRPPNNTRT